ncbi:MAG: hypothetical protein ACJ72N_16955 [Labedaea sp.]
MLDTAGVEECALLGVCQVGPIAVAFAAHQPERVHALVLYGSYARCRPPGTRLAAETGVVDTMDPTGPRPARRATGGPGSAGAARRRHRGRRDVRDAPAGQRGTGDAARINAANAAVDVTAQAARVTAPALVPHLRDEVFVPFEQGRILAALIPGSRFVPLHGRNHVPLPDDPAWPRLLAEVSEFLNGGRQPAVDEVSLTKAGSAWSGQPARGSEASSRLRRFIGSSTRDYQPCGATWPGGR